MGIFSRIGEIINANINTMLDKAEDPVKMVRLMIHEMEDTLMEIKSSAAEVIADQIRLQKQVKAEEARAEDWEIKAGLALEKDREDLAREALEQKVLCVQKKQVLEERLKQVEETAHNYREDISRLEEKLRNAIKKYQNLEEEKRRAMNRRKVEEGIYRLNTQSIDRLDGFERRIQVMEAETSLINTTESLDQKFQELEQEGAVEAELAKLKSKKTTKQTKK